MTFGRVPPLITPTLTVTPRLMIGHGFQRLNDIGEFADGAAAVFGPCAGMRRHALDENIEARDALAPGDDLSAIAGGLGDQHVFGLASLGLDQRARCRAADLFIRNVKLGDAERRTSGRGAKLPERMIGEIGSALHVIDARAESAVAVDLERQPFDETHRVHGIEMAEHQDSRFILAP